MQENIPFRNDTFKILLVFMKVLGYFNLDFLIFEVVYRLSLCNVIEEYDKGSTYSKQLNYL